MMTGGDWDKARQLIFEVRHPDKPPDYDPQKKAEAMVDLLEAAMEELQSLALARENRWR